MASVDDDGGYRGRLRRFSNSRPDGEPQLPQLQQQGRRAFREFHEPKHSIQTPIIEETESNLAEQEQWSWDSRRIRSFSFNGQKSNETPRSLQSLPRSHLSYRLIHIYMGRFSRRQHFLSADVTKILDFESL